MHEYIDLTIVLRRCPCGNASLFVLPSTWRLRQWLVRLVSDKRFDYIILIAIVLNCIVLAANLETTQGDDIVSRVGVSILSFLFLVNASSITCSHS
jgi:hypothetical protein